VKRVYTLEEKRGHVEALCESGLSIAEYAEKYGIPRQSLDYWLRGLRMAGRKEHPGRRAFFSFLDEGLTPYKAGLAAGVYSGTWRYWMRQE